MPASLLVSARMPAAAERLPCPDSELGYAHTLEDPALELALVEQLAAERGRPLRVLVVASGGCTPLALLASKAVAHIDAVDLNVAQLHLVELKRCALSRLNTDEQRALFGAGEEEPDERLSLYHRLREALPVDARAWWDAREDQVRYGLGRVGRFERLCQELAAAFVEAGLDPLRRPWEALGHPAWRETFAKVFDRSRLASSFGTAAVAYSSQRSMSEHYSSRLAEALRRSSTRWNYLMAQLFGVRELAEPPYLNDEAQRLIRAEGPERLALHRGPLLGGLRQLSSAAPFDLIQTSHVTDWLPGPERSALLRGARDALAPGGAVLCRRLNADDPLGPLVARHLEVDAAMSASFLEQERSFLYREVVVGRRLAA
jgi:S-adenosylmethionine-diacylglycerol 3-amino-3-carboxypropyl transferase